MQLHYTYYVRRYILMTMTATEVTTDTPTQRRTRNAILMAAAAVLSQNPAASLSEIADAAGVARSTLHRYFSERNDLIERLRIYSEEEIARATEQARLDQGVAVDALVRLCYEYFDRWNVLTWRYLDTQRPEDEQCGEEDDLTPSLSDLIERGYADGTIDPGLPNGWIQQMLWALLYTGWEYINNGGASRHETLDLTLSTLRRLVTPPEPSLRVPGRLS